MSVSSMSTAMVATPSVTCDNATYSTSRVTSECISNVKIDNDGNIYASNELGSYGASAQQWLDTGWSSSQVWVERSISSGTLDTDDIGGSRLVCSTDRVIGVTRTVGEGVGTDQAVVVLSFYNASSGGTLLDTATFTIEATII